MTPKEILEKLDNNIFDFQLWLSVQRLNLSCILWDLRGLKTCEKHGFHAQNWFNGKCKKCERVDKK